MDDEPDIGQVRATTLEAYLKQVRVRLVESVGQALRVMESDPMGLIISDFKMPGMDGLELLRICSARYSNVPRIMMTANADMEIAPRALQ